MRAGEIATTTGVDVIDPEFKHTVSAIPFAVEAGAAAAHFQVERGVISQAHEQTSDDQP